MKQQRLNFSDYPAIEQEYDSQRIITKVPKHVYLLKVDGEWSSIIVRSKEDDDIKFYEDMSLKEVYNWLKKHRTEYTAKVIQDEGLEKYLRCRRDEFKPKYKQLIINFNGGRNG